MQAPASIPAEGAPQRRRPLVGLALAAACGCVFAPLADAPLSLWASLAVLLCAAPLITRSRWLSWTPFAACAAIFGLAALLRNEALDPHSLRRQQPVRPSSVELVGLVAGEPAQAPTSEGTMVWTYALQVEAVHTAGAWREARDRVRVSWTPGASGERPALGDRWIVRGLLRDALPGARSQAACVRAEGPLTRCLGAAAAYPFLRWCEKGRAWCAQVLGRGLEDYPQDAAMLRALVLGYREDLSSELFQAFSRTGTLHVVAVSGSHVAIFAGILAALLRVSGLPRTRWFLLLAPALILYSCSTGLAPSAIRACIMAMIYWASSLFGRQPDGPTALAASALCLLGWDPGQVHDPGFVLSYVAVGGLMLFYPPLREWMAPAPASVPGDPPARGWTARLRQLSLPAARLLAASLAAWLVTTPLTAQYFNLFSPSGLLLNLIAIPLAGGILLSGTLSIFCAFLPALVSESFNHASRLMVSLLVRSVDTVDDWPFSHLYVVAPGALLLAAWALALTLLFFASPPVRRRCAFVLLAGAAWWARGVCHDRSVSGVVWAREKTMQGFVDLPGGQDVLIDTGRSFRSRELIRGLRACGVNRLGVVVITRPLSDCIGGLPDLLREIPIGEIWCGDGPSRSTVAKAAWAEVERCGLPVRRLAAGASGTWPGGVEWRALQASAPGDLALQVARGPASLTWRADARGAVEIGKAVVTGLAGRGQGLEDGESVRWRFADERIWRAGQPAVSLGPD